MTGTAPCWVVFRPDGEPCAVVPGDDVEDAAHFAGRILHGTTGWSVRRLPALAARHDDALRLAASTLMQLDDDYARTARRKDGRHET